MQLLMNVITAWISVALAAMLSIIWIFRIVIKKNHLKKNNTYYDLNRTLRKWHKFTGISFVAVSALHGILSTIALISFNFGTAMTALGLLMGTTYYLRKRFTNKQFWIKLHRVLTLVILLMIPIHILEVDGFVGIDAIAVAMSGEEAPGLNTYAGYDYGTNIYSDGFYSGVATGYGPGLEVSVEMKDNQIVLIEILEHNEDRERFYLPAFESIPAQIVENQCLDVDVVSGSTYSSVGIVNAVANAMDQALLSGESCPIIEMPPETEMHVGKGRNRKNTTGEAYETEGEVY
jgi:uncharacterized protein with FMN-binding domain